ncbi:RelA/SpoT domain-containing protein [Sphingobacterium daejeonense]|uniref:RelA/SpoT domain-containing protein n=1 Tax=Sphingobacterium daejeonense TaxID=371142 RepID=UPI0010C458AE|nr:RelA/SpoT domain-containing protein [Sphingobacterium daejeonense]VTP97818.1 Guanosine polyphosphate pyrophosphohydrolases/synthetases [Sphingobacterium daejeonense]
MDIKREYNELINDYEEFLNEISRLIERLLNSKNIPIAFEINKRVKTFESIQEKIYSNKFRKGRSLKELNDLIGLRIVVLFPEYKDKVINLLESNFIIIKKYNSNITF